MSKKWKFRGEGGDLREIPSVVGVWIFSGTTQSLSVITSVQSKQICSSDDLEMHTRSIVLVGVEPIIFALQFTR